MHTECMRVSEDNQPLTKVSFLFHIWRVIQKLNYDFKSEVISITQNPVVFYQEVGLLESLVKKFQIEHSSKKMSFILIMINSLNDDSI